MAWLFGAGGLQILLLLSCVILGSGLHVEILGGRNDQLFSKGSLIRHKREWIVPPAFIWEERDNSNKNPIAKIWSDRQNEPGVLMTYTISGEGVTEPPYGLFLINGRTGELNITSMIVDREQTPIFHLKGYALNQHGQNMEKPLDLRIKVMDINDNNPVFSDQVFVGSVEELCAVGTLVMKINASDADEANNLNSKIAFRIISQEPSNPAAFIINKATGEVRTATFQLDREEHSSYSLTVEAKDRDGDERGLGKQTTVQIKILDVNDNIPVLEKATYEGSVKENSANVEIMRMKVFDRDEEFTDNWLANFTIVSGNEGGYFRIETDSVTNEGILTMVKEIDYEELQNIDLQVVVSNKAAYHKSIISQGFKATPIPVKIKVENVREGPVFKPQTLVIKGSETMKVNQIIGSFQAYEEDGKTVAKRIRYVKGRDIGNWLSIDSKTSEIKLIKVPDYESSFVVNGTYIATILAVTDDYPSKTATGTIAIQVEDVNDHCPTLVEPVTTVCNDAKFINVTVNDQDAFPNSGPFTFTVIDEPDKVSDKWVVGQVQGSTAQLIPQDMKLGTYNIPLLVKDNQGFYCPEQQILTVTVCDCEGTRGGCFDRFTGSSVVLGPAAIALMILALLLLLLVPLLLLACRFGSGAGAKGFATIPNHSEEMLRNWNSEGAAPDNEAILNLIAPSPLDNSASHVGNGGASMGVGAGGAALGSGSSMIKDHYSKTVERQQEQQIGLLSGAGYRDMEFREASLMAGGGGGGGGNKATGRGGITGGTMTMGTRETMAMEMGGGLNEEFLRGYFTEKADAFAGEDGTQVAKDCLLIYSQEEESESPHGSVGCCSFIEDDFDDRFLDDLGDKFKILAEICTGKRTGMEAGLHLISDNLKDKGPSPATNELDARYLHQQNALTLERTSISGSSHQLPEHMAGFGSETMVEETVTEASLMSRPGLQQVRPIPDPMCTSDIVVTEASYGAVPPTVNPQFKENVVVTERVLAPASSLQNLLEMPNGVFPDLPDSKYVVVRERERVLVPSSDLSIPNLSEGQNVVMTERVITPTPCLQSMTEPTTYSGSDRQEHILISDPLFSQANTQETPTLTKSSRVTKYSSVQYTRS